MILYSEVVRVNVGYNIWKLDIFQTKLEIIKSDYWQNVHSCKNTRTDFNRVGHRFEHFETFNQMFNCAQILTKTFQTKTTTTTDTTH